MTLFYFLNWFLCLFIISHNTFFQHNTLTVWTCAYFIYTQHLSFPEILINFLLPFHLHRLSLSTFPHPSDGEIFTLHSKLFIIVMCPRVSKVPTILHAVVTCFVCCWSMRCLPRSLLFHRRPRGVVALLLKCGPLSCFPTLVLRRLWSFALWGPNGFD